MLQKEKRYSLPFFSVILTTYNRISLISRALNSLLLQTENDWEAILIDDGSEDNSISTIIKFFSKDRRLRYYYQENKGVVKAKNRGIQLAKGRYITFLDSDDEYHNTHLSIRKKVFEKNSHIDFLHGGAKIIGDAYVPDIHNPSKRIHIKDCAISGTFFIKNERFKELKGFQGDAFYSDNDLLTRAEQTNFVIEKITNPTYIYHHENKNSITHRFKSQFE